MLSIEQLDKMGEASIKNVDRSSLTDIKTIRIDTSLPITKRMACYLEHIGNPYCFRSGETPVKIRFSETGGTLDEAVKDHYLGLKIL